MSGWPSSLKIMSTMRKDMTGLEFVQAMIDGTLPHNSMADAEKWAVDMPLPAYAIDDQTAIKVVDDSVEVISEGHWKLFTP